MLDLEMTEQLKNLFAALENTIELSFSPLTKEAENSPDLKAAQLELLEMLGDVANCCPQKIKVIESAKPFTTPIFQIQVNGKPTGITFQGVPGGHEFSSLIVAIINADGKGKMPPFPVSEKIKNLKGPIQIRTYISLTCENCPDVIQSLNQMALIHDNFQHTFVDGALVPAEIESLKIQGVPAVFSVEASGLKLIHSGRISLLDLIAKLEAHYGQQDLGKQAVSQAQKNLGHFDVVVVGGGPAGVTAAIYSVRKGLKTALLSESIGGQVLETKGIENFISLPYTEGPKLAESLGIHLAAYPVKVLEHRRVKTVTRNSNLKEIAHTLELEGGEIISTESLIIATGAKWRELGIEGEKAYLGRGVAFCPHCDGPYYKGKSIAVVGGGNSGVEAAIDLAGIVKHVTVVEYGNQLKADQVLIDKLKSLPNTSIITQAKSTRILGNDQTVNALEYLDRTIEDQKNQTAIKTLSIDGVFVQIGLLPNSGFLKGVVELSPFGEVIIDGKGRTSAPGIYAAGDVTTTPYKQIIIAMGEGAKAALSAFEDRMKKTN